MALFLREWEESNGRYRTVCKSRGSATIGVYAYQRPAYTENSIGWQDTFQRSKYATDTIILGGQETPFARIPISNFLNTDQAYYPEPVLSDGGYGLKYKPLDPLLPDTISYNGYPSDVEFEVTYGGDNTATVTITNVTLSPITLYKNRTATGNGRGVRGSVQYVYDEEKRSYKKFTGIMWNNYYGVKYDSIWAFDPDTPPVVITDVGIKNNIPAGTYSASTLSDEYGSVNYTSYSADAQNWTVYDANNYPSEFVDWSTAWLKLRKVIYDVCIL